MHNVDLGDHNIPDDWYILWTGSSYENHTNSLRYQLLGLVKETHPITVIEVVRRARKNPNLASRRWSALNSDIRNHQGDNGAGTNKTVYLLLQSDSPKGPFRTVTAIPNPHGAGFSKPLHIGAVVNIR